MKFVGNSRSSSRMDRSDGRFKVPPTSSSAASSSSSSASHRYNHLRRRPVRILRLLPPNIIKIEPAEFRSLVQQLTGYDYPQQQQIISDSLQQHPPDSFHSLPPHQTLTFHPSQPSCFSSAPCPPPPPPETPISDSLHRRCFPSLIPHQISPVSEANFLPDHHQTIVQDPAAAGDPLDRRMIRFTSTLDTFPMDHGRCVSAVTDDRLPSLADHDILVEDESLGADYSYDEYLLDSIDIVHDSDDDTTSMSISSFDPSFID